MPAVTMLIFLSASPPNVSSKPTTLRMVICFISAIKHDNNSLKDLHSGIYLLVSRVMLVHKVTSGNQKYHNTLVLYRCI